MTAEEIQTVFNRAADLLERDGWCQGKYWMDDGRCCLVGAAMRMGATPECWQELSRRTGVLHPQYWNDEPGRTVEEVLAVLRGTQPCAG